MVTGSSEEAKAVRNGLMLAAACLPLGTRVTLGSELLPMAMSESMTARVCVDTHSPCYHQGLQDAEGLWPFGVQGAMLI